MRVTDSETIKKFEDIKRFLGLRNDAEVLRLLVNAFWRKIRYKKVVFEEVVVDG